MAFTYEPIATTSSSGGTTISFTSIPSTYTDLKLVFVGATGAGICQVQYNGTSTNYSSTLMYGSGSPSTGSYSVGWIFVIPGDVSEVITQQINIQNYANTNVHKTSIARADIASASVNESVQLWRSNSAINRVDLISSGTYGSYTATLYGIKAA
jgi:hypothetical protein